MKALTLWQPWASAIALGQKRIETRSWATSYRGPMAIHAAKRPITSTELGLVLRLGSAAERDPIGAAAALPLGAVVAVAELVACVRVEELDAGARAAKADRGEGWGEFGPGEAWWGNYERGRFAWILSNVRRLEVAVPVVGRQGLWEWTP